MFKSIILIIFENDEISFYDLEMLHILNKKSTIGGALFSNSVVKPHKLNMNSRR